MGKNDEVYLQSIASNLVKLYNLLSERLPKPENSDEVVEKNNLTE